MFWHRKAKGLASGLIRVKENSFAFGHGFVEAIGTTRFVLLSLDIVGFSLGALLVVV